MPPSMSQACQLAPLGPDPGGAFIFETKQHRKGYPMSDHRLRRGMKPWRHDAIPLKLSHYIRRDKLPPVPAAFGHVTRQGIPWGMDANDVFGCCVTAGGEHEHMVWALSTGRSLPWFGTQVSEQNYSDMLVAEGGQPLDPSDPSTDTGLDPVQAAAWRKQVGLLDAHGARHKVDAYVAIDQIEDLDLACYLFGVCGCGFQLPDSAEDEFSAHKPWTDTSGDPDGGHYVPLVGKNSNGERYFITWGELQGATDAWIQKYLVGAVAYVSREYILATGRSPEGIDWATLEADLQSLPQDNARHHRR